MKLVLLMLFNFTLLSSNAQFYINKSREKVIRQFSETTEGSDTLSIKVSETDSSITYSFKDGKVLPADFIYGFDESGKCNSETVVAYCDSCFQKYLGNALKRKELGWKKINERLYISHYHKRMMLEIPPENPQYFFVIRKMKWTRGAYKTLVKMMRD